MKCKNSGCNNKAVKGRKECHGCIGRRWRNNNPIKAAYRDLRSNAKRRGKEFIITFEYFKNLCKDTGYIEGKGRFKSCLTIDRVNPLMGYVEGNIRVILNSDNSRKGATIDKQTLKEICPF